jgi:hypothetical protein
MKKASIKTQLAIACLGLTLPLVTNAATLTSGFSTSTFNNTGELPWGSHTDHGSEWYCVTSTNGKQTVNMSGGELTLNSYRWVANGYNYQSGVVWGKVNVPSSGYNFVTLDCDIYTPYAGTTGLWPAWWLDSAWTWPPEIDIAEFKGNIGGGNVWQNAVGSSGGWSVVISSVNASQWHHYGLALGPASGGARTYQLFLDGVIKNQGSIPDAQGVPFWVIFNYANEGDSGTPGPTYNTYIQRIQWQRKIETLFPILA